jgi:hypothetical protein
MHNDDYLDLEKVASGEMPVPDGLAISTYEGVPNYIDLDDVGHTVSLTEFVYEHRGFLILWTGGCWMIADPFPLPGWEQSWVANCVHDNCSSAAEARRAIDRLLARARLGRDDPE